MTAIIINPGSGPIAGDPTKKKAKKAIKQFVEDLELDGEVEIEREKNLDDEGRFGFALLYNGRKCEVEMPGLSLEDVRYVGRAQNILHFPRLYVDGSSWVWKFAVGVTRDELLGVEQ